MRTRLKTLRKDLKLTQKEFGDAIGVSNSNISNIENGSVNLTARNIYEICSKFNVNEDWLKYGIGNMYSDLNTEDEINKDIGKKIKQRRKDLGLSIEYIAEKLNKNRATIYRYENSTIENLPLSILKPLSEILQTNVSFLLDQECNNINNDTQVNSNTLKDLLIKKSSELNDIENLNLAINFIEKLIENENYKDNIK